MKKSIKREKAPNGWYDPSDGSIHIDLNAGSDGKGTMLFTVAHELTHYIKDWSPVKYRTLANLLVEHYARNGQSVQELIDAQKAKAEANGRSLTTEQAFDEVVADSMEAILARGDLGQFMQRVQQRDKTLWQKVRTWFQELTDKLKAAVDAYRDYTPDSPEGLVEASENYQAAEGQKNTTREGGSVLEQARSNKKIPSNQQSANVRRSVKQRGAGSTHVNMSSTAAANLLGIDNISNASDKVKYAISVLGEFYNSVAARQPVMGFRKTISGSNLEGSLVATNVLIRQGTSGSAYRKDGEHELRVSNHSAHSENFKGNGEHLSIALKGEKAINKFLTSENNVIEAIFSKSDLDSNPKKLKALIVDIARFIATGEYHDTAGAEKYNYSGTEEFVKAAQARMQADKEQRDNIMRSDRDPTAAATAAEIEKQNKVLEQDVRALEELLKAQGKDRAISNGDLFTVAEFLKKASGVTDSKQHPAPTAELAKLLGEFYGYIRSGEKLSWNGIAQKAQPVADWLRNHTPRSREQSYQMC